MSTARHPGRLGASIAGAALVASLLAAVPASAASAGDYVPRTDAARAWIVAAKDPAVVAEAVGSHAQKLPVEFDQRIRWADSDGTLQVMVSLVQRDPAVEDFVRANTVELAWYGDSPRFLGRVTPDQLATLLASTAVLFVEPDYPVTRFMSASAMDVRARSTDTSGVFSFDPSSGPLGALISNIPGLTAEQVTGHGVRVAITDSGIDKTHKDFGGWDCVPGPYLPCESRIVKTVTTEHVRDTGFDPSDALPTGTTELASGHGAHVAGTIGGNGYYTRDKGVDPPRYGGDGYVIGIAPNSDLISVKNGDTLWAGMFSFALQWQLDHADEYGIKVSSNSWGCLGGCGFNPNAATSLIFRDLYRAGVVTVFAVGNDGGTDNGSEFSGYAQSPYVLGVAAYDDDNDQLASFSSRGVGGSDLPDPETWSPETEPTSGYRRPDVGAPGVNIWSARTLTGGAASVFPRTYSADVTGGRGFGFLPYATMSGTSMATPHVAGAAAVLFGACAAATSLDVMRAVMAGATPDKVLKTDGSGLAESYETGYGALDVRAALDRLLGLPNCGGSQPWAGSEPDPDPTTDPDPTPATCPGSADASLVPETAMFFHRSGSPGSELNEVDSLTAGAVFDAQPPTEKIPAMSSDFPLLGSNTPRSPGRAFDAAWTGSLGGVVECLTFDLWQKGHSGETLLDSTDYQVTVWVGSGTDAVRYQLPNISAKGSADPINHIRYTIDQMYAPDGDDPDTDPDLVDLRIDPLSPDTPVTIALRDWWLFGPATILYDSTDYPSGVVVNEGVVAQPTIEATTVAFTEDSAHSGQYSDETGIAARLVDEAGDAIAGAEVSFEMVGASGSTSWTATTDDDGIAVADHKLAGEPGQYQLTVRFGGRPDVYEPSADTTNFVIELEDSVTVLELGDATGRGRDMTRRLSATIADEDSHEGIAGREVVFFCDGSQIGTSVTGDDGVATFDAPMNCAKGSHEYQAIFDGDSYYLGSSDTKTS